MSRSPQKNYLDRLLTPEGTPEQEEREDAQRTSTPLGSALLTRANTLERIGSGELKQVAQVRLDPKRCRIWPGNGRNYAALNYDRCKDLIEFDDRRRGAEGARPGAQAEERPRS